MADDWTGIAGMVMGAGGLLTVAVPRIIDAWRAVRTREIESGAAANEREASQRFDITDQLLRARERDHEDYRKEVEALRIEIGAAKDAIDDCHRKHATSEAQARVFQDQIADQRDVIGWMRHQIERLTAQIERLSRDSGIPPAGEPAE